MSNEPVLITEAGAENIRRGLREVRELGGTGQPRSRRRWPLDDGNTATTTVISWVRVDWIYDEIGDPPQGAHPQHGRGLNVIPQMLTYPSDGTDLSWTDTTRWAILFSVGAGSAPLLDAGIVPSVIQTGFFSEGIVLIDYWVEVVTLGSEWIIHNGDGRDYRLHLAGELINITALARFAYPDPIILDALDRARADPDGLGTAIHLDDYYEAGTQIYKAYTVAGQMIVLREPFPIIGGPEYEEPT